MQREHLREQKNRNSNTGRKKLSVVKPDKEQPKTSNISGFSINQCARVTAETKHFIKNHRKFNKMSENIRPMGQTFGTG